MSNQLSLNRIVVDPTIQIRHGYNEDTVRRYMEILDQLPAVTVFDTTEGYLLADGFHRMAAAGRLGWKAIKTGIRKGSRKDAEEFAARANSNNALPLTRAEREDAVRRLLRLDPDRPYARIAEQLAVSPTFVAGVADADTMRSRLGEVAKDLSSHHLKVLVRLPATEQVALAETAVRRDWSTTMLELAVQNLKDERLPAEFKDHLIEGSIEPVYVGKDGSYAMPIEAVVRESRRLAEESPMLALEQALGALARLRTFSWPQIMAEADSVRRERIRSEMPGYIRFLEEGLKPSLQILDA